MPDTVTDIIDGLQEVDGDRDVGDVVEMLEHRGTAPLLIIPPLVEMSPAGFVPGVPSTIAAITALFAAQIVMGHPHLWLPNRVARRQIPEGKLTKTLQHLRPWAEWLDRTLSGHRLHLLVSGPARRLAATLVVALCILVPPLEVVPGATTLPMTAILCIGLALLFRNGVLMLLACGTSVAAFYVVIRLLF